MKILIRCSHHHKLCVINFYIQILLKIKNKYIFPKLELPSILIDGLNCYLNKEMLYISRKIQLSLISSYQYFLVKIQTRRKHTS